MALCIIQGRSQADDVCFDGGRAGIEVMWLNSADKVTDLTFNTERQITAITTPIEVGDGFKRFEFEADTAFLNQAKTRTRDGKGAVNVAVQISFNLGSLVTGDLNALENLNQFKRLHAVIRDNNGKYWYAGINYFEPTDTWTNAGLITGEGSANTGADPTADAALLTETLVANSNWYLREYVGTEAEIPVN